MQVPVIQRAGLLSVMDIALRLQELQLMAEEGHLHQEDLEGMNLTILWCMVSNLGNFKLTEHVCSHGKPMPGECRAADILR